MIELADRILTTINLLVAILILYLGFRNAHTLSLILQKWAMQLAIFVAAFFALGEILAIVNFLFALPGLELLREIVETTFIVSIALLMASEQREVSLLRREANIDSLTKLHNQAYFRRAATRRIEEAKRYGFPLAMIVLDIDNFKSYNDQFGHEAGNKAPCYVALVLQESVRADDFVARYGGEEFVVLMTGDLAAARVVAERIRLAIESQCIPQSIAALRRQITVSLGIAILNDQNETTEQILEAADAAMYQAKQMGKNRVYVSNISPPRIPEERLKE